MDLYWQPTCTKGHPPIGAVRFNCPLENVSKVLSTIFSTFILKINSTRGLILF